MSLPSNLVNSSLIQDARLCTQPQKVEIKWGFRVTPETAHIHLSQLAQYLWDVALVTMDKGNMEGYQKYSAMSDCVSELHEELLSVEVQR